MNRIILLVFCLALSACGGSNSDSNSNSDGKSDVHFDVRNDQDFSSSTKIMLIAGSRDSAEFVKEITDQKKYWLSQGYKNDEISCYYVPPLKQHTKDPVRFAALSEELKDCFYADLAVLAYHFRLLGSSSASQLYIYITSHGSKPFKDWDFSDVTDPSDKEELRQLLSMKSWSSPFTIDIEERYDPEDGEGWDNTNWRIWHLAIKYPDAANKYLLTPESFRKMLTALPSRMQKNIILSTCYAGGFLLPGDDMEKALISLPNIRIMTASAADRKSFVRNSTKSNSDFDEAFFDALRENNIRRFEDIDWSRLYAAIQKKVDQKEDDRNVENSSRSLPQFFSNVSAY
jgi:hypothetical protein